MSLKSVLLSGATGSVGAHVLSQLLSTNHRVTAIVRSLSKSSPFLTEKYSSHIKSGSLKLVEIPDLTTPHAFDALAKTVDAIIHVATPLASGKADFQKEVIDPTWLIDHSVLTAAAKAPYVKRLIITGTILSTFNVFEELFSGKTIDDKSYNSATHEEVTALNNSRAAYMYAKTAAELKSWEFMEKEKPGFDLVVLLAPSIIGRSINEGYVPSKDSLGGMSNIYQSVFDVEKPGFLFPYVMDVEDVAAIHLKSLDLKVPGNERYLFHIRGLLSGPPLANKIREEYPQLRSRVAKGEEIEGALENLIKTDISKFEKVFGSNWNDWWESSRGTVEDVLKLTN